MPLPFLALASLLSGGISAIKGISQKNQANDLIANNPYPEMEVPQAILQNQQLAQTYANQGLPSQQYNQSKQNIARTGATALRNAGDRRSGLMAAGAVQQNNDNANLGLDVANSNAVRANQKNLMAVNNTVGQWQNNVWDWNKRQKYLQTAASARALLGAGNANIDMGLDRGLAGAAQIGNNLTGQSGGGATGGNNNQYSMWNYGG